MLPLPPEIFLDLWAAGSQEVIQIHHRVDTSIEKCEKTAVTTSDKSRKLIRKHSQPVITVITIWFSPGAKPTLEGHNSVVVNMQEREVAEFLLQHEEEGVEHVQELGDVENPGQTESSDGLRVVGIVHGLTGPAVVACDVEPANSWSVDRVDRRSSVITSSPL